MELIEQAGDLDLVLVPDGGGGQLSGGAVAASGAAKPPRVIGVEPAAVGQSRCSLDLGRPRKVEVRETIADGQQLPSPGDLPFAVVRELVEEVICVTDDQILPAMGYLCERQKLVVAQRRERGRRRDVRAGRRPRPPGRRDPLRRQHRHRPLRLPARQCPVSPPRSSRSTRSPRMPDAGDRRREQLAETAFLVPERDDYRLRWFTPVTEVPLCGHATLASAAVVLDRLDHMAR